MNSIRVIVKNQKMIGEKHAVGLEMLIRLEHAVLLGSGGPLVP